MAGRIERVGVGDAFDTAKARLVDSGRRQRQAGGIGAQG
jgi:hypothetical protein